MRTKATASPRLRFAQAKHPPLWIAAHEAGHAITMMTMLPDKPFQSVRICYVGPREYGKRVWDGVVYGPARDRLTPFQDAVVAAAGPFAEYKARHLPRCDLDCFFGLADVSMVYDIIGLAEEEHGIDISEADVLGEARRIVNANWSAVVMVAKELRERRRLTYRQIELIMEKPGHQTRAWGAVA